MSSKQSKPGRLRAVVSPNAEGDKHLNAISGLESAGKHASRKEGSK
jgi:hypothetical protein